MSSKASTKPHHTIISPPIKLCVVCKNKPATKVHILCRHSSVCSDCTPSSITLCPSCLEARMNNNLCPVA